MPKNEAKIIEEIVKHLPGLHDQKKHAKLGNGENPYLIHKLKDVMAANAILDLHAEKSGEESGYYLDHPSIWGTKTDWGFDDERFRKKPRELKLSLYIDTVAHDAGESSDYILAHPGLVTSKHLPG